ncbi:MAG: hypothetical protein AB1641_11490 [Thermodesulfobacteriota bacterium]
MAELSRIDEANQSCSFALGALLVILFPGLSTLLAASAGAGEAVRTHQTTI